ncbi:hypothetical protein D5I55_08420 [Chakrabartia godavariana]|nr:hypothetical protein D5I55_08420 [Chakrabartia godavariana]
MATSRHDRYRYPGKFAKASDFRWFALPICFSNVNFTAGWFGEYVPLRKLEEPLGEWRREPWAIPRGSSGPNNRGKQQDFAWKWIQQCLRMQEKVGSKGVRHD